MKKPKKQAVPIETPEQVEAMEQETQKLITDTRPGGCTRPNAEGISIGRGTIRYGK